MPKDNKYLRYTIIAIFGSFLAILGDFLIGYITPGAIGKYGFIQTGWSELSTWRLSLSLVFAAIAFILYLPGIYVIRKQLERTSVKTAKRFYIAASATLLGGLYIHILFCAPMFIYKYLADLGQVEIAIDIAYGIIFMMLPAAVISLATMLFAFLVIMIATVKSKTIYKRYSILVNPLILMPLFVAVKSIFPSSPFALGISTSCINGSLMIFFIYVAICELKAKRNK